ARKQAVERLRRRERIRIPGPHAIDLPRMTTAVQPGAWLGAEGTRGYPGESMLSRGMIVLIALGMGAPSARAQVDEDAANIAHQHYDQGMVLYVEGRYADAMAEFEIAQTL